MAIRLTAASNQYLSTAADPASAGAFIDYNSPYTVLLAWRPQTVGAEQDILGLHASTTSADVLFLDGADNKLKIFQDIAGSGTTVPGATVVSAGTWYYIAMVRHSVTSIELFVGTSPSTMASDTGGPVTAPTVAGRLAIAGAASRSVRIGTWVPFNSMVNARLRYARVYETNLSLANIKTANGTEWAEWLLPDASTTTDSSGNGRDLIAFNTPTTEADDTVTWPESTGTFIPQRIFSNPYF